MNGIPTLKYLAVLTILWLWASLGSPLSAQNTLQIQADSSCWYTIYLEDSLGGISNHWPPYLLEWSGGAQNNNSYAHWRIDMGQLPDTIQSLKVTDGNGAIYRGSLPLRCGVPVSPLTAQATILTRPTNCSSCNGSVSISVGTPVGGPATFVWSDSVVTTGLTGVRNSLCPGIYTVLITDAAGNQTSETVDLNCGIGSPTLTCDTSLTVLLEPDVHTQPQVRYPQDAVLATSITNGVYYWVQPSGTVVPSLTFDCDDAGYHALQVVVQDTQTAQQLTCPVLLMVADSSHHVCSNNTATYDVQGIPIDASTCSTCDGVYQLARINDIATGAIVPLGQLTFLWSDGVTTPQRNDLCPLQNYTLTIWDSSGVVQTEQVTVGCPLGNCTAPGQVNPSVLCTQIYDPVCGCDGQTYLNACVASYEQGLASWTRGTCPNAQPLRVSVQTTPDAPCAGGGCSGTATVSVVGPPNFFTYQWSNGNLTNTLTNVCSGTYQVTVTDSVGQQTVQTVIVGQIGCVWPGDADDNGVANHYDLLQVGLAQGGTGPARINASSNWSPQAATDWNANVVGTSVNAKYADTDGSGTIDTIDVDAIQFNYGRYYARTSNSSPTGGAPLYIGDGRGFPGDTVSVPIYWGDASSGAVSAYGVAFTLHYDARYVDTSTVWVDFDNTWLGNNLIQVQKDFRGTGELEVGVSRTNNLSTTGVGQIGTVNFIIKEDLIMGRIRSDSVVSPLGLSGVRAVDHLGQLIPVHLGSGVVRLKQTINLVRTNALPAEQVLVYPNPVRDLLTIESKAAALEHLRLYAANGQLVVEEILGSALQTQFSTQTLPTGIYILEIQTSEGLWQQKLHVQD